MVREVRLPAHFFSTPQLEREFFKATNLLFLRGNNKGWSENKQFTETKRAFATYQVPDKCNHQRKSIVTYQVSDKPIRRARVKDMTDAMIKNTTDDKSTISSDRSHHLTITK